MLIATVALSIVFAILFDVRWWMNSHAKQLQIKLQVAEEDFTKLLAQSEAQKEQSAAEFKR